MKTERNGIIISDLFRNGRQIAENKNGKKRRPDTLSLSFPAYRVHPVVPIARSEKDQSVFACSQRASDTRQTVLINGSVGLRRSEGRIKLILSVGKNPARNKRNPLGKKRDVFRQPNIEGNGMCKPEKIIAETRADPDFFTVFAVMPPMQDIPFFKLRGTGAQDHITEDRRFKKSQTLSVLQLIPKAESASALILRRSCEHSALRDLIFKKG